MATIKPISSEEGDRFRFHPATEVTGPLHDRARSAVSSAAATLCALVPDGRHRSLMLTALQEAMMWANAGIACDTEDSAAVSA